MKLHTVIALAVSVVLEIQPCPAATSKPAAGKTVADLYQWVFAKGQNPRASELPEKKDLFEATLYDSLLAAFKKDSNNDEDSAIDFAPFVNAQDSYETYSVGDAKV